MIGVDNEVKSHQVNKVLIATKTELIGQVETVVLLRLYRCNLSILENVPIYLRGNCGKFSNEVHGVLKGIAPVLFLVDTLSVSLSELRLMFQGSDRKGELGHRVQGVRAAIDELLDEFGDLGTGSPLGRESLDLLSGRDLASQKQPKETLGKGLLATLSLGQESLAFGDLHKTY